MKSEAIAAVLGALLPEGAIVCDESVTTGRGFLPLTRGAPAHDWLQLTGGAIGVGIPLATGAAVAAPDRKVHRPGGRRQRHVHAAGVVTQAREKLNVMTLVWANRSYRILKGELTAVGAQNPGRTAMDMLSLDNPELNWVQLANGMGVEAVRVETLEQLADLQDRLETHDPVPHRSGVVSSLAMLIPTRLATIAAILFYLLTSRAEACLTPDDIPKFNDHGTVELDKSVIRRRVYQRAWATSVALLQVSRKNQDFRGGFVRRSAC